MGIDYHIRFARPPGPIVDEAIRGLPFFRDYDPQYELYNLCLDRDHARPGMPDAHAKIEPDGIHFCANCASDVTSTKEALIAIGRHCDPGVTVEEL